MSGSPNLRKAIDPVERFLPDLSELNAELEPIARRYISRAIRSGILLAARELNRPPLTMSTPEVAEFIRDYTGLMANRVNRTLVERIREALVAGLTEGDSYRALRDRLLQATGCQVMEDRIVAGKYAQYCAERIARTESARANNAGAVYQAADAGATRKVWRTNAGCCEFCEPLEGMVVGIAEPFFPLGATVTDRTGERTMALDYCDTDFPPLHPNCTCYISYEFED